MRHRCLYRAICQSSVAANCLCSSFIFPTKAPSVRSRGQDVCRTVNCRTFARNKRPAGVGWVQYQRGSTARKTNVPRGFPFTNRRGSDTHTSSDVAQIESKGMNAGAQALSSLPHNRTNVMFAVGPFIRHTGIQEENCLTARIGITRTHSITVQGV